MVRKDNASHQWGKVFDQEDSKWPRWKVLLLGQLLSLLYFLGPVWTNALEITLSFSAPNFIAFCVYGALSLFLLPLYNRDVKGDDDGAKKSQYFLYLFPILGCWKAYMIIGFIDYLAMATSILALNYTTITSYTLIWASVTPFAMLFSKCLLRRKYTYRHCVGVLLCMIAVTVHVLQEAKDDFTSVKKEIDRDVDYRADDPYMHKLLGDALVLLVATLYGLLDVICEYALGNDNSSTAEYLGATGFFAAAFALIPAIVWERVQIRSLILNVVENSTSFEEGAVVVLILLAQVSTDVGSYYVSCRFLEISESALMNLSTLTVNIMAVIFSVTYQKEVPPISFFVGMGLMVAGLFLYESSDPPKAVGEDHVEGDVELLIFPRSSGRRSNN